MNLINFTKSQGLGNDFIIIEDLDKRLDLRGDSVKALCDRHFGVGGDGLIMVNRSPVADFFMNYYNADGSIAKMCGNGMRVFARYLHDHIRPDKRFAIETRAGIKNVELILNDGEVYSVSVDMGAPQLECENIPIDSPLARFVDQPLPVGAGPYRATGVSMGNPHCVIFVDSVDKAEVLADGPIIEELPLFPAKANVGFVEVLTSGRLRLRVWERGVGETLACGTGACAAVVAAHLNGLAGRKVNVELPGGVLNVEWLPDNTVTMNGPAKEVFTGQVSPETCLP